MAIRNEWYLNYMTKLPAGLERFVAQQILEHRGKDLAIRRERLVAMAASRFPDIQEVDRTVRRAIEKLREDGWLIGMNHNGDGYYLITSREEYETFRDQYVKRAYTIIEKANSMDAVAKRVFSEPISPIQVSLF